ncbi:homocysteine methyltransferase [Caproiciproducens sp. NJN-50]|uniref:homocysteine S-methyltransferase family protein n=1 Tax=Acutalibacteraceae TaxID=3082771 RepID=UPI000FFE2F77|nr:MULTISPECIES: homocysteine S-methyltransferase family protein [Acutalibacteraceae]QAT49208.1 homocysteine methyltransferase [Caproiciproducens sp. NJN-50]
MDYLDRLPLLLDPIPDFHAAGLPSGAEPELWLAEHPGPAGNLLRRSLSAGVRTLCAPTLCANRFCLPHRDIPGLNRQLVKIAKDAAGTVGIPVGGAVGPSGLFVPPHGEADFDDIYDGYREQIRSLDEAGADFLLLDGLHSLSDLRAALLAARTTGLPVIVLISVDSDGRTMTGGSLLPALITLQAMGADAVGLSCAAEPELAEEFRRARQHAAVPFAVRLRPDDLTPVELAGAAVPFLEAGVRILGTGIGAGPEHVKALAEVMKKFGPPVLPEEPDCDAAAIEQEAFFLGDDIVLSEPIRCTSSLADDLIDLDDEQVTAALVDVTGMDDAALLGEAGGMTRLPIAVHADSPTVLDAALRYFQGRLIIDSNCQIERETLEPLAAKYGAILY